MQQTIKDGADHRVLVARRRRTAMRLRILRATMEAYAAQDVVTPSVEEVIQIAGISKAGFYRYYSSTADALSMIGHELAEELASLISSVYDVLSDPLQRACIGTILVLRRAAGDPVWAEFMLRADLAHEQSTFFDFMHGDINRGIESGQFSISDGDMASELVMGINQVLMRGIASRDEKDRDRYVRLGVTFLLRSFGVKHRLVEDVLDWSDAYLDALPKADQWWNRPVPQRTERLSTKAR